MADIKNSAVELIGNTPILKLNRYTEAVGVKDATILAKLEYLNPAGSVKDRVALAMIQDAEKKGLLKEGATIIEPTSGNTGIGLAAVATARGYRTIITLPDTMSVERRNLLKAYGAELVLTEGAKGMKGAIEKAEALKNEIADSIVLGQFVNPANPAAQIANVHTIFNIATTVILFPFGPMLVNIAKQILPDTQVKHVMDADQWFEGLMASKHHLGVSTIAISQIHEEIRDMLAIAASNVSDSFKAMEQGPGENGIQEIADREEEIDLSNVRLSKKISKVLVLDQTPQDIEALNKMYSILGNIERIGDHAMNLAEYAQTIQEKNLNFSDYAKNEFKVMDESCALGMELLRKAAAGDSDFTLEKIQAIEQKIDDITDNFRQNQIDRMREGHCNVESSILYSEMLTDYERIGDHMLNIGEAYDAIQWNSDKAAALAEE